MQIAINKIIQLARILENPKSRNVSQGIRFKLRRAICININIERGATNMDLINVIMLKKFK